MTPKHSAANARATGEFVHNLVTVDLVEEMHRTSESIPPTESEFDHADIETAEAESVSAPCVAAAQARFECTLYDDARLGDHVIVMGEIEHIHVDDSFVTDSKVDVRKVDPVGRLTGDYYATVDRFEIGSPPR